MKIGEAFNIVKSAEKAREEIIQFCYKQIPESTPTTWCSFYDYRIDSKNNKLIIEYEYGGVNSDMEFTSRIIIDMTEYLRDDKLNDLLNEKI